MRTRVKVCGITTPEDAAMAARAGADYVGVILTESPRRVTPERAREIALSLPAETQLVAVFAGESPEEVERSIRDLPVHAVQVRGWDREEVGGSQVWHVLRASADAPPGEAPEPAALPMVPLRTYLLDAHDAVRPGGTGRRADWDWARRAVNAGLRLVVAGGLDPENVGELVREIRPFGVDASSGLEREPGKKDAVKVRAFLERIREADRSRPKRS